MRRLLVLPLALLLPLACSSDGDGDGGGAGGDRAAGGGSFCAHVEEIAADVREAGELGADPAETVALLRDLSRKLGAIDPPAEIADAWELYVDGTADFANALQDVEPGDNVAATEALVEFARTHGDAIREAGSVARFVQDECGVSFTGPLNP